MPRSKKTYDIFISHSSDLRSQAEVVIEKFSDGGLCVFRDSDFAKGSNLANEAWQAIAESWAFVALIQSGTVNPSVAVEIGAASAWLKPIYILKLGQGEYDLPSPLTKYQVFHVSEIDHIIADIQRALRPFNDEERRYLLESYQSLGIPTDKLLTQPAKIDYLNNILLEKTGIKHSGERIMQELLRLRKRGKLPRLRKK